MNLNRPREYIYQEFDGFMYIQCECGVTRTFCTKNPITHFICKCGKWMELGREDMKIAFMRCECGKMARYNTNVSTELVEIDCVTCGSPNVMEWSSRKKRYIPIRERKKHE